MITPKGGAIANATWMKEHPNLNSWGYIPSLAVLGTAAYPVIAGAGNALMGTKIGSTIGSGVSSLMSNPLVEMANGIAGMTSTAYGVRDAYNGKFTPLTALEIYAAYPGFKNIWKAMNKFDPDPEISGRAASIVENSLANSSERDTMAPIIRESENTSESIHGPIASTPHSVPTQDINDVLPFPQDVFPDDNDLPFPPMAAYNNAAIDNNVVIDNDFFERAAPKTEGEFKVRYLNKGDLPYTEEEVRKAFFNEDGTLKERLPMTTSVYTGGHGDFLKYTDSPVDILKKHLSNDERRKRELASILEDNPSQRSGVLLHTHNGDLSIDSSPLAYAIGRRQGKHFMPFPTDIDYVSSNSLGYNNIFKEDAATAKRAREYFKNHPEGESVKRIEDDKGNMVRYEITDDKGTFSIPLRTRDELLELINKRIRDFNKSFNTNYKEAVSAFSPSNSDFPYPWGFGEIFKLPNIYGIAYENGGNINKRKLMSTL